MRRTAVVIDVSGSIGDLIYVYGLDHKLRLVTIKSMGGCDVAKLNELSKKFDQVYFFTDGLFSVNWNCILDPKITVINVMK